MNGNMREIDFRSKTVTDSKKIRFVLGEASLNSATTGEDGSDKMEGRVLCRVYNPLVRIIFLFWGAFCVWLELYMFRIFHPKT